MGKFNEELVQGGRPSGRGGTAPELEGSAYRNHSADRPATNGPFAETKELVAGFWLWNVKSMDDAVAWLKRCPNPHNDLSEVEIRQVYSAEDFGPAMTPELAENELADPCHPGTQSRLVRRAIAGLRRIIRERRWRPLRHPRHHHPRPGRDARRLSRQGPPDRQRGQPLRVHAAIRGARSSLIESIANGASSSWDFPATSSATRSRAAKPRSRNSASGTSASAFRCSPRCSSMGPMPIRSIDT